MKIGDRVKIIKGFDEGFVGKVSRFYEGYSGPAAMIKLTFTSGKLEGGFMLRGYYLSNLVLLPDPFELWENT